MRWFLVPGVAALGVIVALLAVAGATEDPAVVGVTGFELTCASSVTEGASVVCDLENTGDEVRDWPVVAVSHRSDDDDRALVAGRLADVAFEGLDPEIELETDVWWVGEVLVGYSRFDWPRFDAEEVTVTSTHAVTTQPDVSGFVIDRSVFGSATVTATVENAATDTMVHLRHRADGASDWTNADAVAAESGVATTELTGLATATGYAVEVALSDSYSDRVVAGAFTTPERTRQVTLRATSDSRDEPPEKFYVSLAPSGLRGIEDIYTNTAAMYIHDDDAPSSDASLSALSMRSVFGDIELSFSSGTGTYDVQVDHRVREVTVTPTSSHDRAVISAAGSPVSSGEESQAIALSVGANTIQIVATPEDDSASNARTYTINATRAAPAATVTVDSDGFTLACPSEVAEGSDLICSLTYQGRSRENWPVVAIIHSSADSNRALITEDTVIPASSPLFAEDLRLSPVQDPGLQNYHYGHGRLFSGGSRSVHTAYGYESFDWYGLANSSASRDVTVQVFEDYRAEPAETFYVALAPSHYTGLSQLVDNMVPVVVSESDLEDRPSISSVASGQQHMSITVTVPAAANGRSVHLRYSVADSQEWTTAVPVTADDGEAVFVLSGVTHETDLLVELALDSNFHVPIQESITTPPKCGSADPPTQDITDVVAPDRRRPPTAVEFLRTELLSAVVTVGVDTAGGQPGVGYSRWTAMGSMNVTAFEIEEKANWVQYVAVLGSGSDRKLLLGLGYRVSADMILEIDGVEFDSADAQRGVTGSHQLGWVAPDDLDWNDCDEVAVRLIALLPPPTEVTLTPLDLHKVTLTALDLHELRGPLALSPAFRADELGYLALALPDASAVTLSFEKAESTSTVQISLPDADDEAEGHQVALSDGVETLIDLAVTSADGQHTLHYVLSVAKAAHPTTDQPADTSTTAVLWPDAVGWSMGEVANQSDVDWFAVELEEGVAYQIDVEAHWTGVIHPVTGVWFDVGTLHDAVVSGIYDSEGRRVAGFPRSINNDAGNGKDERVSFTPHRTDLYYIGVTGHGEWDGTYRLSVTPDHAHEASEPVEIRNTESAPVENSPATGAPTISGTAQVGETLTADTSGIADADGTTNAAFSYQWLADDTNISEATDATYTLADVDEGKTIKVRVSFTDDAGNAETLTSAATAAVTARPNSPATGAPTISGTTQVGETLTADTSGIADTDGTTNAAFSYQWQADDTNISEATDATYTLADVDEGKTIKVRVSFTDDAGNAETLTSAATAAVTAGPTVQPPAKPAKPVVSSASHDSVTIEWDDPGDSSITGYQILRREPAVHDPGVFAVIVSDTATAATSYTDTTVAANTQYVYRVKAINAAGLSPESSYTNTETPAGPPQGSAPPRPDHESLHGEATGEGTGSLDWADVREADSYDVQFWDRDLYDWVVLTPGTNPNGITLTFNGSSATVSGLPEDYSEYWFNVRSRNTHGVSRWPGNNIRFTPYQPP